MASNYPEQTAVGINETLETLTGTTPTVDCSLTNNFQITTSGNTTFTFSNAPASGIAYAMTITVTQGGAYTLTWPASVDWPGGTAPDAPGNAEVDLFVFLTLDGGTTWLGGLAGDNLA